MGKMLNAALRWSLLCLEAKMSLANHCEVVFAVFSSFFTPFYVTFFRQFGVFPQLLKSTGLEKYPLLLKGNWQDSLALF